jgi:hypothetical protein
MSLKRVWRDTVVRWSSLLLAIMLVVGVAASSARPQTASASEAAP